jgi:hypothetical protein
MYTTFIAENRKERTFGRHWCRREYNIKVDLTETVLGDVDWTHLF